MKVLSIRQPWAWLVVNGYKPIENRDWLYPPKLREMIFIHAGQGMTRQEYEDCTNFIASFSAIKLPPPGDLLRGGIIGKAELIDCVTESDSPWFTGPLGLVFRNARPLPFVRLSGALGFFLRAR